MTTADRKRTELVKGKEVNFTYLPPEEVRDFAKVTSVCVIPFTEDGQIVATIIDRGIDFPGGHVQEGETSLQETADREAMEEACITLHPVKVVSYIESDFYGSEPDQLTYMVVTTAKVKDIFPFTPNEEAHGREILSPEAFLERFKNLAPEDAKYLIEAALKLIKL